MGLVPAVGFVPAMLQAVPTDEAPPLSAVPAQAVSAEAVPAQAAVPVG